MIVCPVNVVKAAVLSLSIVTLTGCGGGSGSIAGNDTNTSNTTNSSNSSSSTTTTTTTTGSSVDYFSGTGVASVTWTPPNQYTDGTALTTLDGHHIYMNAGNGFVRIATLNNQSITNYLVENLIPGIYTFAVTAFDAKGIESALSSGVTRTVS